MPESAEGTSSYLCVGEWRNRGGEGVCMWGVPACGNEKGNRQCGCVGLQCRNREIVQCSDEEEIAQEVHDAGAASGRLDHCPAQNAPKSILLV